MRVELVCVALAALAASFPSLSDGAPLQVLSAPNLLRVSSKENVFVEIQDQSGGPVSVTIMIKKFHSKSTELFRKEVELNTENNFQGLVEVFIPEGDYKNEDPRQKQYVYLQAQFPDRTLEKVVLLSFQAGYIFIQTDKPLYTPGSEVKYRVFAVAPNLEAFINPRPSITVEIITPQNIIIQSNPYLVDEYGIKAGNIKLPEVVNIGVWKIVCRFQSTPQKTFSAEFEVKEYVLPSFEVQLKASSAFFYVDNENITIDITATYLFGQVVKGEAFAVFGVDTINQESKSLPGSFQRSPLDDDGVGQVTLKKDDITKVFPNINDLVGHSLYVAVSVLTESGGEMVEAEKRGIQIVTSPYTIHFQKTPKYFKPGMPFVVKVYVTNPDQTPAQVTVEVTPGPVTAETDSTGVVSVSVSPDKATQLIVTVKTKDLDLPDHRQASASLTAQPYRTNSNHLLHVKVNDKLALGNIMTVDLSFGGQTTHMDVTYLILSRGQLTAAGRVKRAGQPLLIKNIQVTKEMLPSIRVVAYYHVGADEVVSDSVWVEVKVSCMGKLTIVAKRPKNTYLPKETFTMRITGDPGARVGLVAVDKGVSVLNKKHRLTQNKVWDIIQKHDTGCTAGSGKDSMGVFYDAGLVFQTSTASGTDLRSEPSCPVSSSRKRRQAVTISQVRMSLASNFTDELERVCCVDGMKDNYLGYTCKRRSEYITEDPKCVQAFLSCCEQLETKKKEQKVEALQLARSEDQDIEYPGDNEIRSKFPESWWWNDYTLPSCPSGRKCDTTSLDKSNVMPDSITTWQFFTISLSKNHGICVADPHELMVQKNFFIDLKLPYSAVLNEQLEIKAIVHNYLENEITVQVVLWENEHICSFAHKRKLYQTKVSVKAESTMAVPFVIIPMKLGKLEVMVSASDPDGTKDAVKKELLVLPPGELIYETIVAKVDPKGGEAIEHINTGVPRNQVPDTPVKTFINVTGGEQTSSLVQSVISGQPMKDLIRLPYGCGEQNLASMTLPVIATTYLDKTNQWESVGMEQRDIAIGYIEHGYQSQLGFRNKNNDGSYLVYRSYGQPRPSSAWLTAYVAKVFAMASQLITIEDKVVCDAVNWLILNAQQPDGTFKEINKVWGQYMMGGVAGDDTGISMTAFVLISMQEARSLCERTINSMPASMNKAVSYLERNLATVTNPYAVAMASYALANVGKLNKELLLKFAARTKDHWRVPNGYMYTLEATAYALLALVKVEALEEARPIVRWLSQQNRFGGGYGSTQSTIMVYQAVSEFWSNGKSRKDVFDLKVDVEISGRSDALKYTITRSNQFLSRSGNVQGSNQNITVKATGTGQATIVATTLYYAQLEEKNTDCTTFDLDVTLIPTQEDNDEEFWLQIDILSKNRDAGMTILDIGLLTGFSVQPSDLKRLMEGKDRYIERFEEKDLQLSDRGSLIIYLNKVSHTRPDRVKFRIRQDQKVGLLQPGTVTAYEYYEPKRCRKFYHPERLDGGLTRLCKDDNQVVCDCAEENCSVKKKDVTDESRLEKACEVTLESRTDYVYKASVQDIKKTPIADTYSLRIDQVIKEGTDKNVDGQLRTYLGMSFCRDSLGLKKGKSYLLMGLSKDMHKIKDEAYHYVLGQHTWVEYWPSPEECQTDTYQSTCLGLEELQQQLQIRKCLQ